MSNSPKITNKDRESRNVSENEKKDFLNTFTASMNEAKVKVSILQIFHECISM